MLEVLIIAGLTRKNLLNKEVYNICNVTVCYPFIYFITLLKTFLTLLIFSFRVIPVIPTYIVDYDILNHAKYRYIIYYE